MKDPYEVNGDGCNTGIAVLNRALDDAVNSNNISPTQSPKYSDDTLLKHRRNVINTIHADVQHTLYNRSTRFRYLEQIEDTWNTWLVAELRGCADNQRLLKYAQDALKTELTLRMQKGDKTASDITLESLEMLNTSETLTSKTLENALKEGFGTKLIRKNATDGAARTVVMARLCREFKQAKTACVASSAVSRAGEPVDKVFEDNLKQYLKAGSEKESDLKGSGLTHIQQVEIKRYAAAMEILVRSNLDPSKVASEISVEHAIRVLAFWGHELELIERRIDELSQGSSKKHRATDTMPSFLSAQEKNELSKYRSLFDRPELGPLMQQILYSEHKGAINSFWAGLEKLASGFAKEVTGGNDNDGKEEKEDAGENDEDDDGDFDGDVDPDDSTLTKFVAAGTIAAFSIVGAIITALGAPSAIGKLVTNMGTWLVQGIIDNVKLAKGIVAILTDSTTFLNVLLDAESQLRKINSSHLRGGRASQDLEYFYREKKRMYGSLLVPLEGKLKNYKREGKQEKEPEKPAFSLYSCFSSRKSYAKVSTKIGGEDVTEYLSKAKEEMVAIREETRDRVQSYISIMSAEISNKLDEENKKLDAIEEKIDKGNDTVKKLNDEIKKREMDYEELLKSKAALLLDYCEGGSKRKALVMTALKRICEYGIKLKNLNERTTGTGVDMGREFASFRFDKPFRVMFNGKGLKKIHEETKNKDLDNVGRPDWDGVFVAGQLTLKRLKKENKKVKEIKVPIDSWIKIPEDKDDRKNDAKEWGVLKFW
ncbi:hypothetical protein HDU81_001789 [Chytriomyces hyalinus]|nr:hypothetical protein HDU81_001789 [Chytriomyces hyalinus]